jgi:hypothetical protein
MEENNNIKTNYYLQQRYHSGELNTDKISFTPDESSTMHIDHGQDTLKKKFNIELLHKYIQEDSAVNELIEDLQPGEKVNLDIVTTNKIYSFCMLLLKKDDELGKLNKIEMFDLITSYLNLDPDKKEVHAFYSSLSTTHKTDLLTALADNKLIKLNKLF